MALMEDEQSFVRSYHAADFQTYLKTVCINWPRLRYAQARRKASKLWKARKEWLKSLEPTSESVSGRNCSSCVSTFHETWAPPSVSRPHSPITLTVTKWDADDLYESVSDLEDHPENTTDTCCRGCRENQPNQLAHVDYGGCLYERAVSAGIVEAYDCLPSKLPLLPASPPSTD